MVYEALMLTMAMELDRKGFVNVVLIPAQPYGFHPEPVQECGQINSFCLDKPALMILLAKLGVHFKDSFRMFMNLSFKYQIS